MIREVIIGESLVDVSLTDAEVDRLVVTPSKKITNPITQETIDLMYSRIRAGEVAFIHETRISYRPRGIGEYRIGGYSQKDGIQIKEIMDILKRQKIETTIKNSNGKLSILVEAENRCPFFPEHHESQIIVFVPDNFHEDFLFWLCKDVVMKEVSVTYRPFVTGIIYAGSAAECSNIKKVFNKRKVRKELDEYVRLGVIKSYVTRIITPRHLDSPYVLTLDVFNGY